MQGGAADGATAVTYELYAAPATDAGALAALERRVAKLEQCVGRSLEGLSLWDELQTLRAQLQALEASRLDALAAQLRSAAEAVAAYERERRISPAGASLAGPPVSEAQVATLLEAVQRWDALAASLPTVVARLRALRELHEDAARFAESVARVEAEQAAMRQLLEGGVRSLQQVQAGLSASAGALQSSLAAVELRVAKIASNE